MEAIYEVERRTGLRAFVFLNTWQSVHITGQGGSAEEDHAGHGRQGQVNTAYYKARRPRAGHSSTQTGLS